MSVTAFFGFYYLLCPIIGYCLVRRRPYHTRMQLMAGATLSGGIAGACFAAFGVAAGSPLGDLLMFEMLGLFYGTFIGTAGIGAQEFGRWLQR